MDFHHTYQCYTLYQEYYICMYLCWAFLSATEPGPVVSLESTFSMTERTYEPSTRTYTVDLTITWGEPLYPNGEITSYEVNVTQADDPNVEVYRNNNLEAPNVTVSVMVLAFTNYTVTVAASTSAGQGEQVTDIVLSPEAGRLTGEVFR